MIQMMMLMLLWELKHLGSLFTVFVVGTVTSFSGGRVRGDTLIWEAFR